MSFLCRFILLTALVTGPVTCCATVAHAGMPIPMEPGEAVFGSGLDFVVATILAVRDSGATNAHPPVVTIRVEERLGGKAVRGEQAIVWWPQFPYLDRLAGQEETIRRWGEQPMGGPVVGAKMILGLRPLPEGKPRSCPAYCRWSYSDSTCAAVRSNLRLWTKRLEERRRQQVRRRIEAKAAAESALVRKESDWLAVERAIPRTADIERLVRTSTDIVVGEPVAATVGGQGQSWVHVLDIRSPRRLLASGRDTSAASAPVHVVAGLREDSLAARWSGRPADETPGSRVGRPLSCIAFLRYAHGVQSHETRWIAYRPVDGRCGILLADDATIRRVREALARRGGAAAEPRPGCEASLAEFAGLDSTQAAEVGIKLSVAVSSTVPRWPRVVVIACSAPDWHRLGHGKPAGWFAPCALPDDRYAYDYRDAGWAVEIRAARMKVLLDSLTALPALRSPRAAERDTLSITLRRVVEGRERIYETTLDSCGFMAVTRVLTRVFPGESVESYNVGVWTGVVNRAAHALWHPERSTPRPHHRDSTKVAPPRPRTAQEILRAMPTDYNHNGITDDVDISRGISRDRDHDGVPDECQPRRYPHERARARSCAIIGIVADSAHLGVSIAFTVRDPRLRPRVEICHPGGGTARVLTARRVAGGRYAAVWNGRAGNGALVLPGRYFVQVTAGPYSAARTFVYPDAGR